MREENFIGEVVIGLAIRVHRELGPGLLESAYEACLAYEFERNGIAARRQQSLPIIYDGRRVDAGFRIDFVVAERVILELKAVDRLLPIHNAQLLTYLRLSGLKLGYILNFNARVMKDGIRRLAHNL